MSNDKMKAGRFLRLFKAKRKLAFIQANLAAGRTIAVCTACKITKYSAKHADMFRATKSGLYVQHGKGWDCIDYCEIKAF